jgi:hypothetical protein
MYNLGFDSLLVHTCVQITAKPYESLAVVHKPMGDGLRDQEGLQSNLALFRVKGCPHSRFV